MMTFYNENLKQEYINISWLRYSMLGGKVYLERIFRISGKYEEYLKRDLKDFSHQDILDVILMFRASSMLEAKDIISVIQDYTFYAFAKETLTEEEQISLMSKLNITDEEVNNVIYPARHELITEIPDLSPKEETPGLVTNPEVFSEEEIKKQADMLLNPVDKYMWLAPFYGIFSKTVMEMILITKEQVFEDHVVLYTGRKVDLPKYLIDIILESIDTYEYKFTAEKRNGEFTTYKKDLYSPYAIKGNENNLDYNPEDKKFVHRMSICVNHRYHKYRKQLSQENASLKIIKEYGFVRACEKVMLEHDYTYAELLKSDEFVYIKNQFGYITNGTTGYYRMFKQYMKFPIKRKRGKS